MKFGIGLFLLIICIFLTGLIINPMEIVPKETPYIENKILYLGVTSIPIENITRIEIIRDPVLSVLIHHKNGICSLPFHDYLKISKYFWVGE